MRKGILGLKRPARRVIGGPAAWLALVACVAHGAPAWAQDGPPGVSGTVVRSENATGATSDATDSLRRGKDVDPAAARADAKSEMERLADPAKGTTSAQKPAAADARGGSTATSAAQTAALNKQLRELLEERLRLIDLYDQAAKEFAAVSKNAANPDDERAAIKADLARITERLTEAQSNPDVLLPPAFRALAGEGSTALSLELKEALDATAARIKDDRAKLEQAQAEKEKLDGPRDPRRDDRDKLFQKAAAYEAKRSEFETALAAAPTAPKRRLAQERLANFDWQARVDRTRLATMDAETAGHANRSDLREWEIERLSARLRLEQRTLEIMRERYRTAAEDRQRELKRLAAIEDEKAQRSNDPIERFRARRMAEILTLEALVVRHEQSLATSPSPSLHEQRDLADRAEADFAHIRELLDDGRVSRLDAIRLNNDFRRIGPERDRLSRNELAYAEAHVQYYENLLSSVEIELLQDSLHDQFELDFARERPPTDRIQEGKAIWAELEQKQRALLIRRRAVLEKLVERATQILQQVSRRLAVLDEEYGFIRTHIFWVRDQDPLGAWTVLQIGRDLEHTIAGVLALVRESLQPKLWGQPSGEFIVAALALASLPLGLARLRRGLLKFIAHEELDPPPPPHEPELEPLDPGVNVEIAAEG